MTTKKEQMAIEHMVFVFSEATEMLLRKMLKMRGVKVTQLSHEKQMYLTQMLDYAKKAEKAFEQFNTIMACEGVGIGQPLICDTLRREACDLIRQQLHFRNTFEVRSQVTDFEKHLEEIDAQHDDNTISQEFIQSFQIQGL